MLYCVNSRARRVKSRCSHEIVRLAREPKLFSENSSPPARGRLHTPRRAPTRAGANAHTHRPRSMSAARVSLSRTASSLSTPPATGRPSSSRASARRARTARALPPDVVDAVRAIDVDAVTDVVGLSPRDAAHRLHEANEILALERRPPRRGFVLVGDLNTLCASQPRTAERMPSAAAAADRSALITRTWQLAA